MSPQVARWPCGCLYVLPGKPGYALGFPVSQCPTHLEAWASAGDRLQHLLLAESQMRTEHQHMKKES